MSRILIVDSGLYHRSLAILRVAEELRGQGHVVVRPDLNNQPQEETPMLKSDVLKFAGNAASALAAAFATLGSMGTHRRVRTLRSAPIRPTGAALRNPADPFQAERIERAAAKRHRKAMKLMRDLASATTHNFAHGVGHRKIHSIAVPKAGGRLNPFHVNR